MRARYYDPSIHRFTSEDPAEDGLNWYAYCGNNPVMFSDPSGLEIRVTEDVEAIMPYLESLTEDTLCIDIDGYIYIEKYGDNIQKNAGTELIRRLIANQYTCEIQGVIHGGDSSTTEYYSREKAGILDVGSGSIVRFNYKRSFSVQLDNNVYEREYDSKRMALAHELIHSLRGMGGYNKGGRATNIYSMNQEEAENTGIDYINPQTGQYVNASQWKITENTIRTENHLARRIKY